jgi:uncharacterized damage-inducible protein DinB
MAAMATDLVETWRMSCAANRFLLEHVPDAALGASYAPRTRSVARQFAHLHDVRLKWLSVSAPARAKGLKPLSKDEEPSHAELVEALDASGESMAKLLEDGAAAGKVKGWKGSPTSFLGYVLAHEAHHRALAIVALRAGGHKLPQEVVYGLWEWGKLGARRGASSGD